MTWQLQDAKNKFSEVVETSLTKGPQIISRRGKNTAVVMSYADYQHSTTPNKSLKELVKDFAGLELPVIERDKDIIGRPTPFNPKDL